MLIVRSLNKKQIDKLTDKVVDLHNTILKLSADLSKDGKGNINVALMLNTTYQLTLKVLGALDKLNEKFVEFLIKEEVR